MVNVFLVSCFNLQMTDGRVNIYLPSNQNNNRNCVLATTDGWMDTMGIHL